jgi:hypothetical protein
VENIKSTDSCFLILLREFNRQRVKRLDEVLWEEIVSANPEESHRVPLEHRKAKAAVDTTVIKIKGRKQRARISSAKEPLLNAISAVMDERRDFWPLTERQIHYALLNDPPLIHAKKPDSTYENTTESYKAACELITRASGSLQLN